MSQISASTAVDAALSPAGTNGFGEMSSADFIRIIFTELSNQDPFQPNDSSALLNQLNSIRSIESDLKLTEKIESLVFQNKLSSAGNLLGKFITGITAENDQVGGFVISVLKRGDQIELALDTGRLVPTENVLTIEDPAVYQQLLGQGNGTNGDPDDGTGEGAESGEGG